ncbi:DNA-directed RNA polymerase [Anoxybacillus tepidamans]|uniref:DNA-directed RNA polymerase n=1 Tax=Anoxybacteroides tepidamans TaxID=265948 RepID=A0A7W8IPX7_9BACL|nr:sigma-70 family RNA polymerase sigma factor [Anoxybacillus tepidamans]MBB5323896.1 DNA-directed RNA polymerase [Anoxybacillus tepidamans]
MEPFEQLEEMYRPMIVSIMKKLHLTKEWDEYYQIGLIALWEASEQFQPEKGSFSSFVYKKVYWSMISHLRKQCRRKEKECLFTEEIANIIPAPLHDDEWSVLADMLQGLTERQKKWVMGYIVENKPLKTIAEEEGVSVGTVKQWRVTALKRLRKRQWS